MIKLSHKQELIILGNAARTIVENHNRPCGIIHPNKYKNNKKALEDVFAKVNLILRSYKGFVNHDLVVKHFESTYNPITVNLKVGGWVKGIGSTF